MELPKDSMNNFIILTNGSIWYLAKCSIYRHHIVQMTRLADTFGKYKCNSREKSRGSGIENLVV